MSDKEEENIYEKLGYTSQVDYFDTRLPIYNDFLSFENYQEQLQNKQNENTEIKDTEIKFTENPIMDFDYRPNLFYANLAKDAYNPINKRNDFLSYKYLENESTENLATYINDEKNELSFAIPGTNKAGDFLMNTAIATASSPLLGFDGRYSQIDNKIKEVKNKYPDYKISVSGHSAGGSLANYLGVENPDYAINTYNMGQGLPFLTNTIKCKLGNCNNINNFRIIGDWASGMSNLIPGNVFNLKPIIPTEEIQLDADSKETFFFPSYMNIPHTINQFIDRDTNEVLPDYAQYGRKLSGNIGGLTTALAVPFVSNKINTNINNKIDEKNKRRIRNANIKSYLASTGQLSSNPGVLGSWSNQNTRPIVEARVETENPLLGYSSNFFSNLQNTNEFVSGLAGFGAGEILGTALYEGYLIPEETKLFKKYDNKVITETEITDFDKDETNIPLSILAGTALSALSLGAGIGSII